MEKEKTFEETEEFLKQEIESGTIVKGGFIEECLKFEIDFLKELEVKK